MLRFPRTAAPRPLSPADRPQRIEDLRFQRPDCREKLKGISRVAVVGGGFGGLMAALELIKYGVKVTVFEAHTAVGGRVRSSKTFVEGRITEFGAELIGSFHTKWLGLARKYGLAMISRMEPELYQQEGLDVKLTLDKPLSMDEFFKLTKEMNDKVLLPIAMLAKLIKDPSRPWNQKWLKTDWLMTKLDNMSVATALEKILKIKRNGPLWKLIEFKLVNDEVDTLDEMNFLGLLCKVRGGQGERFGEGLKPILMGYWDELEIFRCADGCQQLARDMATEITNTPGCRVELNKMVEVIDILDDKVKLNWVRVENKKPVRGAGQSEYCEFVILAIPPSVWDDVTIRVGGEKVKLKEKIGPIGMAPAVKFFSEVKKRFWINDKDKAAPYGGSLAIGQVWEGTDNQTRLEGRRGEDEIHRIVLSVFAGPIRPGREAPKPDDFIKGLELLYPGYKSNLTKPPHFHFANWPEEPFIMTGYVSPAKGQILTIGPKLSKPFHHRLFFAGEHTQMDHFGYMEGALRSGERAAHTLMLKKCGLLKESAPKSPSRPPQKPAPKSPSPPLVARATPTRESPAFERESGIFWEQYSSADDAGEAESPFLHQELFAKRSEELDPRAAALVAESPFQAAFAEEPEILVEPELEEAGKLSEDLLAEEEFVTHYPVSDEPDQEEAEEPRQGMILQPEVEESDEFLNAFQEEEPITEARDSESEIENLRELSDTLEAEVPKGEEGQSEAYPDFELDEELDAETEADERADFSEVKEEGGDVETEPFEFQTAIPPKGLKLTEHFHVPKNLPDGRSGTLTRLDQQSMNPGFVSLVTDDLLVDRRPDGLQTRLDELIKTKYARFLVTRSSTQEGARAADRIRVALADLTGGKLFRPDLAGWGSIIATDGASVPKICALYAVHQLQSDLNHLAATKSISRREDLIRLARAAWQKIGFASMPRLDELFMFVVFEGLSRPVSVSFSPDLLGTLTKAFKDNNNCAVDRLISQLGFPYIASVIWQSGLRHPTRGGLWLWGGYCCTDIAGIRRLLNVDTRAIECTVRTPKDGLSFRWKANSVQQPKPVFAHNATALSVATFFTLLAQGRLINEQASDKIARTLQDACSFLWEGQLGGLRLDPPPSKCGVVGALKHDCVLIKRTEGVKEIHYAAVALTIGALDFPFPDFLKDVDKLIQDKN